MKRILGICLITVWHCTMAAYHVRLPATRLFLKCVQLGRIHG